MVDYNDRFEDFYDSVVPDEKKDISINTENDRDLEKEKVLNNLYLKENCKFIFNKGASVYNVATAEKFITYLAEGYLNISNPQSFLYENSYDVKKYFTYAELLNNFKGTCKNRNFRCTGINTFFTDIISILGTHFMNGNSVNLVDFNIMLSLFIDKAKRTKASNPIWNGVNLEECEDYALSTKIGFRIFRFQYNAELANTVKYLFKGMIRALTINDKSKINPCSVGILDSVGLDFLAKDYNFSTNYEVLHPEPEKLKRHTVKILNYFEALKNKDAVPPNLNVYLCCTNNPEYLVTKCMADIANKSFQEMYNLLKHITDWSDADVIADKVINITKGLYEEDLETYIKGLIHTCYKAKPKILDKQLYNLCKQYDIPNINYVLYDWNDKMFMPCTSEITIDYQRIKGLANSKEEIIPILEDLYVTAQNINILRKFITKKDDLNYRVTINNVDRDVAKYVYNALKKHTMKLESDWSEHFSLSITLYKEDLIEKAKEKIKSGAVKEGRDKYKKNYGKENNKFTFPSGEVKYFCGIGKTACKATGKQKREMRKNLLIDRIYFDYLKDDEDEL